MKRTSERRHAIVIGGSMAGLVAARVLTDHYQQVTLLERDTFPKDCGNRRGVPQGRHTHGLLASGRQVLETLYPGISRQLTEDGAVAGDIARDARWFTQGACLARFESGLNGLLMSRPFLEGAVRKRTLALSNLQVRENCVVDGLSSTANRTAVTGVRIGEEVLSADLVVDASGRGSRAAAWLENMGYQPPREEQVQIALAYTTRLFRRTPQQLNGDIVAIIPPTPEGKRGGVMLAQENDRWTVTLINHFGPAAPSDLNGFIEYSKTLPAPYIYEVIRHAEPIGDAMSARFPASLRRRYEELTAFPEGFLVFGDAISSFNPIYGQGMSVSALESLELNSALKTSSADLARTFFTRAAKLIDIPWSIAVGNDLRMKETVGPRSVGVSLINWYMARLHRAGQHDPVVANAFHQVANLLQPPPSVMHPKIAVRVLWGNLHRRRPIPASTSREGMTAPAGGTL